MPHTDEVERYAEHVYAEEARQRRRRAVIDFVAWLVIALVAIWLCVFLFMPILWR